MAGPTRTVKGQVGIAKTPIHSVICTPSRAGSTRTSFGLLKEGTTLLGLAVEGRASTVYLVPVD